MFTHFFKRMTTISFKSEEEFVHACADAVKKFAKQGPVDCVISVEKKVVEVLCFVLETDVEKLRAEVARLKAEKAALEKEKHIQTQWQCHRGND